MHRDSTDDPIAQPEVRGLLHDVNDELSIATLQLEMLLEGGQVTGEPRGSLQESLDACRKAADRLKEIWRILEPSRQPR